MPLPFDTYLSPFTWRYGSLEMRQVWSETHKRRLWRQLWVTLAEVQAEFGLVQPEQVADLRAHMGEIDLPRALQIEAEIRHDLMAELKVFAEQAPIGGAILHLGATSTDILDNADVLRIRHSLDLLFPKLSILLEEFAARVEKWADVPVMALTHLQPAEPITLGYRLAFTAQDLLQDWRDLSRLRSELKAKGFRGAVGTSAAYSQLLGEEQLARFAQRLSEKLELPFFEVVTQVYPRKQEYRLLSALAGLGGTLYKFAFDLRLLQSPALGELGEPFAKGQVGSSAMPFKRNPVSAEKLDSLGRMLAGMPRLAWDNAAHSLLERTLDDSANRRTLLPEAFLIADEMLINAGRILRGVRLDTGAIQRNLESYAPFAAQERVLMALVKAGADRQEMHERLRQHALEAWNALQRGEPNPLPHLLITDPALLEYLSPEKLSSLMVVRGHLGDAPQRARALAAAIRSALQS